MSTPTGDPALIRELNDYLGRELGRRPNGKPIYAWKWSNDLFWPAFATGRNTTIKRIIEVPVFNKAGAEVVSKETVTLEEIVPEYTRDRQVRQIDTWYVTKWLTATELIFGWFGRHGEHFPEKEPDDVRLRELWESRFPGADFPGQGWRVPTDAWLPRSPGDSKVPNWNDTRFFVAQVKHQASQNFVQAMTDWDDEYIRRDEATDALIGEQARESFSAFLNPKPGARGGFVSFPWSKQDRSR